MATIKLSDNEVGPYLNAIVEKINKTWDDEVETTPFMVELKEGKLKKETITLFYKNWGSFVPVINSVYTLQFYRNLAFFIANVDLMVPYTNKVLDEFGHPEPPGHIKVLISTGEALGLTVKEILEEPMLPEARALADFQRTLATDGAPHEYWFSVLWEFAFGMTCLGWFNALTTHYGMTAEQADYFHKHHEADTMDHLDREAHSEVTKKVLNRMLTQGVQERVGYSAEYCALTPTYLYKDMLNAAYAATH